MRYDEILFCEAHTVSHSVLSVAYCFPHDDVGAYCFPERLLISPQRVSRQRTPRAGVAQQTAPPTEVSYDFDGSSLISSAAYLPTTRPMNVPGYCSRFLAIAVTYAPREAESAIAVSGSLAYP